MSVLCDDDQSGYGSGPTHQTPPGRPTLSPLSSCYLRSERRSCNSKEALRDSALSWDPQSGLRPASLYKGKDPTFPTYPASEQLVNGDSSQSINTLHAACDNPLVKKKRNRADATQLRSLNDGHARTAFAPMDDGSDFWKDLGIPTRSTRNRLTRRRSKCSADSRRLSRYSCSQNLTTKFPLHKNTAPLALGQVHTGPIYTYGRDGDLDLKHTADSNWADISIRDLTDTVMLKEALHIVHARGGFGEIRWGVLTTGEEVALKSLCVRTKTPGALRETKRFKRETRIWSRLKHPNILPFLGIADFRGLPTCLVSPLMQHGNCNDYLDRYPSTPILPIVRGIACGLSYLHDQTPSVIHGDLSCSNVLISKSGQPLLNDFGLAVITEDLLQLPISSALKDAGNTRWMAPELLLSGELVNKTTDIWALGMVFLEVMTREIPFVGLRTDGQVIMALHRGERPSKPAVNKKSIGVLDVIWDLCERCWSQKPLDRPNALSVLRCLDAAGN